MVLVSDYSSIPNAEFINKEKSFLIDSKNVNEAKETACDQNEPTGEKVKDVLNGGLEKVGEGVDTISDKIHDVVDHHNHHHKDFTPKKFAI